MLTICVNYIELLPYLSLFLTLVGRWCTVAWFQQKSQICPHFSTCSRCPFALIVQTDHVSTKLRRDCIKQTRRQSRSQLSKNGDKSVTFGRFLTIFESFSSETKMYGKSQSHHEMFRREVLKRNKDLIAPTFCSRENSE